MHEAGAVAHICNPGAPVLRWEDGNPPKLVGQLAPGHMKQNKEAWLKQGGHQGLTPKVAF